jgi:hypothetical protein
VISVWPTILQSPLHPCLSKHAGPYPSSPKHKWPPPPPTHVQATAVALAPHVFFFVSCRHTSPLPLPQMTRNPTQTLLEWPAVPVVCVSRMAVGDKRDVCPLHRCVTSVTLASCLPASNVCPPPPTTTNTDRHTYVHATAVALAPHVFFLVSCRHTSFSTICPCSS